jgi:hypothetical protein
LNDRADWSLAVAVAAVLVAAVLATVSLARDGIPSSSGSDGGAEMAALVPSDALVYVHVSLDRGRDAVDRIVRQAERFPSYVGLRDNIRKQLASPDCDRATAAIEKADDAAFSLFVSEKGSALSLLLIDQGGTRPAAELERCGALYAANVGPYLAIGQRESLAIATTLNDRGGNSLQSSRLVSGQFERLPDERAADGWLSVDGVRRVLVPQNGVLGLLGVTVDQPRLRGLAFAVAPSDKGASLAVRSALTKAKQAPPASQDAMESVLDRVPAGVLGAFVVPKLGDSLGRLGGVLAGASGATALAALPKSVIAMFDQPTSVTLKSAKNAPVMTLLTTTDDEASARSKLATMSAKQRALFPAAVKDGYVALATKKTGLDVLEKPDESLAQSSPWQAVLGGAAPKGDASLLFLDFSKLLALAEQTGLGSDNAYRAVRADLGRISAAGARISSGVSESTVDLSLLIP